MEDEKNASVEEISVEQKGSTQSASGKKPGKKRNKKWPIVLGTIAIVLVVAGVGFWNWHEQPSFCSAICHDPMDPYLPTYEAETGQVATDKWGNEVADGSYMMASYHRTTASTTCLDCHNPVLSEQVTEAANWATGNFYSTLDERSLKDLTKASGTEPDSFCLNESCHNITRADLESLTADEYAFNPHSTQHGNQDCTSCHKSHRQSIMLCTECHTEAVVPEGWLSAQEGEALAEAQGLEQAGLSGI